MSDSSFQSLTMPLAASPRVSFADTLKALRVSLFSAPTAVLSRVQQAALVRRHALCVEPLDHRMAADMRAAADRHEH